MIILDTNVLSEMMRPIPNPAVAAWLDSQVRGRLFTTAITQAEILLGIALLPAGKRRNALEAEAIGMLEEDLGNRIVPFDSDAAKAYAEIMHACRAVGRHMSTADGQIAAIAFSRGASLATRNIKDFASCDVKLVDPWQ